MTRDEFVFGVHAVGAVLSQSPERVLTLMVRKGETNVRVLQLLDDARTQGLAIEQVTERTLEKHVGKERHQGIAALVRARPAVTEHQLETLLDGVDGDPLLLVLDQIQDPHNLGACLRAADGAGVHVVIAPKDRAVGLTPAVRKVASGAAESVPFVRVANLARCLRVLKERGIWLVGTSDDAPQTLYESDLARPVGLVMGAEQKGLRRLTREHCDLLVSIPMYGSVESLNVAVASGICLYEATRQRRVS